MAVPRAARPFLTGQYRVLIGAVMLSLLGTGVWLVASVFQVRALGGGPLELSWVATGNAAGLIVAVLLGGAIADRVPQKRILVVVELAKIATAVAVAVLALSGALEVWQLVIASAVLGLVDGFFYPAYSALLPSILPADDLLAANGLEGALRPTVLQAAGPALGAIVIATLSPAAAFVGVAASQAVGVAILLTLRSTPLRREELDRSRHPAIALLVDIRDGFSYMARTPWLLATLLFASVFVLVIMGPIEVLIPFAVTDNAGGDAGSYAVVLAAFGVGGAIGSLVAASLRLPRRYLTIMNGLWGVAALPLVVVGATDQVWVMAVAAFVVGLGFNYAGVIWGTLLQRRVPPELLGRVSSLDFFVSLVFMPVSMALAGSIGEAVGLAPVFLVAGLIPPVLAVIAIVAARMPRDELAHPLESEPPDAVPASD